MPASTKNTVLYAFYSVCLLACITVVLTSVSEFSGRTSFSNIVQTRINDLQQQYTIVSDERDAIALDTLKKQITLLKQILLDVENLEANGSDLPKHLLSNMRERFLLVSRGEISAAINIEDAATQNDQLSFMLDYSSIKLFAMAIIVSGIVGGLVASLRKDVPLTFHGLCVGASAGFSVFLLLIGGKDLFFVGETTGSNFNPYTGALFGLLGGMFSEALFELMKKIMERATRDPAT